MKVLVEGTLCLWLAHGEPKFRQHGLVGFVWIRPVTSGPDLPRACLLDYWVRVFVFRKSKVFLLTKDVITDEYIAPPDTFPAW